jgi:8-oxo-dGTP pyrophosphatase MutT (NUDIX family)
MKSMDSEIPSNDPAPHSIITLDTREVYANPWMRLREDRIQRSNGQPGIYGVVDKDDAAIIIPLDFDDGNEGRVWLVEQFRYTIQQRCLELPQGGWEMGGIDPEELARGELQEELGLDATNMTYLGTLWIAYGFANQKQHVFLATGLTPAKGQPDPEEHDLVVHTVTIREFEQMMLDGVIRDNCTLSAWGLYLLWKARQQASG